MPTSLAELPLCHRVLWRLCSLHFGVRGRFGRCQRSNRVVLLIKGHIAEEGSPAELMRRCGTATLTDAYIALTGQTAPDPG